MTDSVEDIDRLANGTTGCSNRISEANSCSCDSANFSDAIVPGPLWVEAYRHFYEAFYLKNSSSDLWLNQQCENGNIAARVYKHLLLRYRNYGKTLDMELRKVVLLWVKNEDSVVQMHTQCILAEIYLNGFGCARDELQAVFWLRKSAELGHMEAQYQLGWCCYHACGMVQDYEQAVSWWRKAADQGHAQAQYWLGRILISGTGVSENRAMGTMWLRKAAAQGHVGATGELNGVSMTVCAVS